MKRLFIIFSTIILSGCQFLQTTANFFITTTSTDKTPVDIQVKIGGHTIFNDTIGYTNIVPDLRNNPFVVLPKGEYIVTATADSGKASITQPIMLDGDRWIFINYSYSKAPDSNKSRILKETFWYDTAYLNKKLQEAPPRLTIHIIDKQPIHQ